MPPDSNSQQVCCFCKQMGNKRSRTVTVTRATYLFSCAKGVAARVEGRWAGAACNKPLQEPATLLLLLLLAR